MPISCYQATDSRAAKNIHAGMEYVVPLSDGSKAVFQWPSSLTKEDVDDLRDSLKIVEWKIARAASEPAKETANQEQ